MEAHKRSLLTITLPKSTLTTLYLDFRKIKFMDSSGIGLIMVRYKNIRLLESGLRVIGTSDSTKRTIKLSSLGLLEL
ncbi:MAG: STAS domain-containing protein [Oscillospiraceae bacterium]|nr:STAS domain-containing protein [Oscillospiraceae bacterium]